MSNFSILVIDDNYEKVQLVGKVVNKNLDCDIKSVNNIREALQLLRDNCFDLLVVDMNLPEAIGDSPKSTSGCDLIKALFSNDRYQKPLNIIAVTSHLDAFNENKEALSVLGVPFLLSTVATDSLDKLLASQITYYQSVKLHRMAHGVDSAISQKLNPPEKVTLSWLTKHLDWKYWWSAILLVFFVFSAGVKLSDVSLIKEAYGLTEKQNNSQN